MTRLPAAFLGAPIAHRGYHDAQSGRPENSRAAVAAAVVAGYGIEIDVQAASCGTPMVFHDATLDRLTAAQGPVAALDAAALAAIPLRNGDEGIPTLDEILALVARRVALLVEIKDNPGAPAEAACALAEATARRLAAYDGPVAAMSFGPHAVAAVRDTAPKLARGLVTCAYTAEDWPHLDADTRAHRAAIADFDALDADFISHDARDLTAAPVARLAARGVPVLCWTIRSAAAEAEARRIAANVTFEGYAAHRPGA